MMDKTVSSVKRGNPLATEDQEAVERIALALLEMPAVQMAAEDAGRQLKELVPHDSASAALFESEFEQLLFNALEAAVNNDPNYPRIHAVNLEPHLTDGRPVPGTKTMHPSPDFIYRLAPVDGGARFVLHGRRPPEGPLAFEVSLLDGKGATQGNLSIGDIVFSSDGSFTISVDPTEVGGRSNHLQSKPGAAQLIIRDIFDHVENQLPIALRIERLDPPTRGAQTIEELAESVPEQLARANNLATVVPRTINTDPNVLKQPAFFNHGATLVTQAYSMGQFKLNDDQALVIKLTLGAAGYAVVPVTNCWGGLGDFPRQRTVISTGHATANADGSFTFVLAHRDPGVVNWIQTGGLDDGFLCVRWTAFNQADDTKPTLEATLVQWPELDGSLPPGTPLMASSERPKQLAQHIAHYTTWQTG